MEVRYFEDHSRISRIWLLVEGWRQAQPTTKMSRNKAWGACRAVQPARIITGPQAGPSFIIPVVHSPLPYRAMRTKLIALLICALALPSAAIAQLRQIPEQAKRGNVVHIQGAIVEIDGQQMRLSAGAQIRSRDNLYIVPMSLPPGAAVKYTLDGAGQIHRVWVLTQEEAAAPDKKPE